MKNIEIKYFNEIRQPSSKYNVTVHFYFTSWFILELSEL